MTTKPPAGGFDGVLVTFGEGADDDTANMTLFRLPSVRLTLRGGRTIETHGAMVGWDEETGTDMVVTFMHTTDDGEPYGEPASVPFDQVVGVHVY